ncbi:hypothetical protein FACS1894219_11100 [Clostridia bacterium]|nr:hypothetical protein FACS1894219_11100 [Clostridia bacterium]
MLLLFGASWPVSIRKSYVSRSANGKSVVFLFLLVAGYACGIINKIINGVDYVTAFYALNMLLVSVDIALWFRNRKIQKNEENKNDDVSE